MHIWVSGGSSKPCVGISWDPREDKAQIFQTETACPWARRTRWKISTRAHVLDGGVWRVYMRAGTQRSCPLPRQGAGVMAVRDSGCQQRIPGGGHQLGVMWATVLLASLVLFFLLSLACQTKPLITWSFSSSFYKDWNVLLMQSCKCTPGSGLLSQCLLAWVRAEQVTLVLCTKTYGLNLSRFIQTESGSGFWPCSPLMRLGPCSWALFLSKRCLLAAVLAHGNSQTVTGNHLAEGWMVWITTVPEIMLMQAYARALACLIAQP